MFKRLNIFRPILAILILFIPLYPKFPLANVRGTYVAIRLDDIVVASCLLIWLIFQIKNRFSAFKKPISKLILAYFLAIIASNITALIIYQVDPKNLLILHLLRRFEYIMVFFISLEAVKTKKDLKFTFISLLVATIGVCAYGYGQKYFKLPVISTMNSEFSKGQLLQLDTWTRISSTFAGHYDLAAYMSVALIIIGSVLLLLKSKILKFLGIILIWIPAFQIFTFTASRVSTFAFWGAIVVTLVLIKKYLWVIPTSLLLMLSITSSGDLNQRLLATVPAIQKQLAFLKLPGKGNTPVVLPSITPTPTPKPIAGGVDNGPKKPSGPIPTATPTIVRHGPIEEYIPVDVDAGVARSGEIRFNAEWPRAITAFNKNPVIGSGLGSITLATDNDYLRLLGESGILGFISFISIFAYYAIRTLPLIFKKNKNHLELVALILFGGLIAMLANAIFIDVFEASKTAYLFWIMMGIYHQVLVLASSKEND